MDIDTYQQQSRETDQVPGQSIESLVIPLLGLAGESGTLLSEYKKHMRDGAAYRIFKERVSEELGDILWYVANIASKEGLSLGDIARANLSKVNRRWRGVAEGQRLLPGLGRKLFDDACPLEQRLPRQFRAVFSDDGRVASVWSSGQQKGDKLTNNFMVEDGYRFHDVFHFSYATFLGWSPVMRKTWRLQRKYDIAIDEVQDGARAQLAEELISLTVFHYARNHSYLNDIHAVDFELLRQIESIATGFEVAERGMYEWEQAILRGYEIFRSLTACGGGIVDCDLDNRTMLFAAPDSARGVSSP